VKLNDKFLAQMCEATRILQTDGPSAATAAIQRALHGGSTADAGTPGSGWSGAAPQADLVTDVTRPVDSADAAPTSATDILSRFRKAAAQKWKGASARQPIEDVEVAADHADLADKGKFLSASCTNAAGTRAYKLYVPSGYNGEALPLIVMLHGCKQNPDDFAAGTSMNKVADQNNCFVAYPAQMHAANGSNCWNWFKAGDQQRDRGEPSIIADITREIIRNYHIDPSRVYVAGLSAGGAMAAIMSARYPDIYAAVGIHSGLPVGAAHDMPSAFQAMQNGMAGEGKAGASHKAQVPVIVFHGDRDKTVHPCNGNQALAQCTLDPAGPDAKVEKGKVPHGRTYTKTIRHDQTGKAIAEHWVVHGAGHAWSGGSRKGSFTDPKGPDATQEMLRFFYTHKLTTK
jgi:poly(hydroxyalkanoate) depolymerase family esterase